MKTRRTLLCLATAILFSGVVGAQTATKRFLIVLIGPPASGKSTQTEFLRKKFSAAIIAIDELIQDNAPALARYRKNGITSGTPQANPALNLLMSDRLAKVDVSQGVVLDGYPSTKDQADHLATLVTKYKLPSPLIIQLDVPDDVLRKRAAQRKREDDTPGTIESRLKDYHREMDMLRAYYPEANIWVIDGTKPPADVSKTIQSIIEDPSQIHQ